MTSTNPPVLPANALPTTRTTTAADANTVPPLATGNFMDHDKDMDLDAPNGFETLDARANSLMNGYEVPSFVMSAGGLQALSFLLDHRDDIVADASSPKAAGAEPSTLEPKSSTRKDGDKVGESGGTIPVVQSHILARLATRFHTSDHAEDEDDWYNMTSVSRSEQRTTESNTSPERDKETTEAAAVESEGWSEARSDGRNSPTPTPSAQSSSILMPTAHRRTRSFEESFVDQKSFVNRVVMRQETYADVQCFRASAYIVSFFEDHGYNVDEDRSASSRSTQSSRHSSRSSRSSRSPVAVVHGTDFVERSPRRVPTDEERKAAFHTRNMEELYATVAEVYRVAGIPKGYLDALHMSEVHQGTRSLRPQDARHHGHRNVPVTPPCGEDDEEPNVLMRATEVVLADYDIENAIYEAFGRDDMMGGGHGYAPGASRGKKGGKNGACRTRDNREDKQIVVQKKNNDMKGHSSTTKVAEETPATAKPHRPARRGSAYEFMLKMLWKNAVHFYYQHNAMSLFTLKFVKRSGNVSIKGRVLRLHSWDDAKRGYLVTGVFDRTSGYPKNFKDPFTHDLYAEEMHGGASTTFPAPTMTRQHGAVNARCAPAEDGVTLYGCSIVRQADVYGIFDGRVYGCQVARADRDHRRTAMHAAIQSLAHYRNLFPRVPSLFRILHPQDRYRYPVVNPVGGMYCVPLIVNGAARLVKVDDVVPMDPVTGIFRCLTSSANEFFPTLLEKALLKANGGGVNVTLMESNQVMHQLCGWIPQTLYFFIDSAGNELYWDGMLYASEMWDQLTDMYRQGRMVMSLVRLRESEEAKNATAFVRHGPLSRTRSFFAPVSFPVVDVISRIDNTESKVGRHIRAVMLRDTTKDPTQAEFVPPVLTSLSEAVLSSIGYSAVHREAGVFCLTWEEAAAYFDHCSMSLNPSTLWSKNGTRLKPKEPTRLCCHGVYDADLMDREMYYQPQFHICCNHVAASTQVFLVYTPHTSSQYPLPWPCDGLSVDTVDSCSDGGVQLRLRVYEVTTLPSIVQVARNRDGRPAQTCTFGNCVARRLTGESESPWQMSGHLISSMAAIHVAPWMKTALAGTSGYSNSMLSIAFDVSPGTRQYVVVMEARTASAFRIEERPNSFSYTLTLYSDLDPLELGNPRCVPFVGGRAAQGAAEESTPRTRKSRLQQFLEGDEGQRKLNGPTIAMHSIPPSLNVNSRTVQGTWSRSTFRQRIVLLRENGMSAEKMWVGPQYHLHLSQPDEFCIRLCRTGGDLRVRFPASLKLLLVRKIVKQTEALEGSAADQCDLVLASRGLDTRGVALSSVTPHTVLLDRNEVLVPGQLRMRQEYHAMVYLSAFVLPRDKVKEAAYFLLIRYANPAESVRWLVVRAFAEGLLISPEECRVRFMGKVVSQDTELRKLFADARAGYTFDERSGAWRLLMQEEAGLGLGEDVLSLGLYFDVELENTSPFTETHFPENEPTGRLVTRLRHCARTMLFTGSGQRTKTLRALAHISGLIRQSGLTEDRIEFLLGIARGIATWCSRSAGRAATASTAPPQRLPLLPAGDYVIAPCFVPDVPNEQMRTLKPHLRNAPGDMQSVTFELKVELLRQHVELKAIASTVEPQINNAVPLRSLVDEYLPQY
ncbi:putative calpain-like cysteine peptidase [Leptomonas pyrrhocoris]|uniref:Putative calpain-like cysteine peptidase n=1 Tax=Leptomonas pyrrhocoris TaxID=157538 RepID=A0A0N0VFW7_LEPPY|nr:putative calpain-like cysteine peptidase [Leptomonas pyrrhocoris]KPA82014.1 putative calpain-like cysteine peptidase [Leptomonas pyrrhocoris]|eukprot:XP_015660453.1 putative calpain-like cysteine peptidase [Leptomonas pyrrhocoris]